MPSIEIMQMHLTQGDFLIGRTFHILGNDITIEDKDVAGVTNYVGEKIEQFIEEKIELSKSPESPYSLEQLALQEWLQSDESQSKNLTGWARKVFYGTLYAYAYTEGSKSPDLYSEDQQRYEDSITYGGSGGRVY